MAQDNKPQATGGQTVTVACKMPHGLIMRVFDMVETQEPLFGGGFRAIKQAHERAERVVLNGFAHPQTQGPKCRIEGGFAITLGVPKEFWDLWHSQNKDSLMVKNGLIFASDKAGYAEDKAKERAEVRCGLERLDPNKLPRGVEKADLKAA